MCRTRGERAVGRAGRATVALRGRGLSPEGGWAWRPVAQHLAARAEPRARTGGGGTGSSRGGDAGSVAWRGRAVGKREEPRAQPGQGRKEPEAGEGEPGRASGGGGSARGTQPGGGARRPEPHRVKTKEGRFGEDEVLGEVSQGRSSQPSE